MNSNLKISSILLLLAATLVACEGPQSNSVDIVPNLTEVADGVETRVEDANPVSGLEVRVNDLTAIKKALDQYHSVNAAYPSTNNAWTSVDRAIKPDEWLPGLVPDYIGVLPRDPEMSSDANGPQYLYKSDGIGYKLIAHKTGDCALEMGSQVAPDPKRSNAQACWAYGVWTESHSDL